MQLFSYVTDIPVLIEGEGSMSNSSFQVGSRCGGATVTSVELTSLGVIIRRANEGEREFRDIIINRSGFGQLLDKAKQEPEQLKVKREGKNGS